MGVSSESVTARRSRRVFHVRGKRKNGVRGTKQMKGSVLPIL